MNSAMNGILDGRGGRQPTRGVERNLAKSELSPLPDKTDFYCTNKPRTDFLVCPVIGELEDSPSERPNSLNKCFWTWKSMNKNIGICLRLCGATTLTRTASNKMGHIINLNISIFEIFLTKTWGILICSLVLSPGSRLCKFLTLRICDKFGNQCQAWLFETVKVFWCRENRAQQTHNTSLCKGSDDKTELGYWWYRWIVYRTVRGLM